MAGNLQDEGLITVIDMGTHVLEGCEGTHQLVQVGIPSLEDRSFIKLSPTKEALTPGIVRAMRITSIACRLHWSFGMDTHVTEFMSLKPAAGALQLS